MTTVVDEREQADLGRRRMLQADAVSMVVGSDAYVAGYRPAGLRARPGLPPLVVSRFYFAARPRVAVDVVADPSKWVGEIAAKRDWCARENIRYVLVGDPWDADGVKAALAAYEPPAGGAMPVRAAPRHRRPDG